MPLESSPQVTTITNSTESLPHNSVLQAPVLADPLPTGLWSLSLKIPPGSSPLLGYRSLLAKTTWSCVQKFSPSF